MPGLLSAERLREAFRLDHAPALTASARSGNAVSVTELRSDAARSHRTDPPGASAALMACVHLRDIGRTQAWHGGESDGPSSIAKGACTFHDLRRPPHFQHDGAFHVLAFVFPGDAPERHAALPRAADDRVLFGLAISLLPLMNGSVRMNQGYIDHALRAAAIHVRSVDALAHAARSTLRGGLAPWQQRRARDLLQSHVVEGIPLDAVAAACGLSKSGFLRAFRESFGVPPHQWLLRCRVDRAAELMRDPALALSDIAVDSGFFDQSHFTRAFSQRMGLSPGAWRRAQLARDIDGSRANDRQERPFVAA